MHVGHFFNNNIHIYHYKFYIVLKNKQNNEKKLTAKKKIKRKVLFFTALNMKNIIKYEFVI